MIYDLYYGALVPDDITVVPNDVTPALNPVTPVLTHGF